MAALARALCRRLLAATSGPSPGGNLLRRATELQDELASYLLQLQEAVAPHHSPQTPQRKLQKLLACCLRLLSNMAPSALTAGAAPEHPPASGGGLMSGMSQPAGHLLPLLAASHVPWQKWPRGCCSWNCLQTGAASQALLAPTAPLPRLCPQAGRRNRSAWPAAPASLSAGLQALALQRQMRCPQEPQLGQCCCCCCQRSGNAWTAPHSPQPERCFQMTSPHRNQ